MARSSRAMTNYMSATTNNKWDHDALMMRRSAAILSMGLLLLALTLFPATVNAATQQFPPDSGVVNVRDFGAKGDGRHDDTDALLAAIAAAGDDTGPSFWKTRVVWLPNGTYRVSRPLVKRYAGGRFGSGMVLIGESRDGTTIKLADHASGYDNQAVPRAIIMTTAKLLDGSPTSGGKDYTNKGEGNDAYENFVENLTIDAGEGNPGAIGIDYLANNIGAIRDATVTAPPGSGAIAISMQRKWPGPALLQRVNVTGFDTGVAVANTEYGVTLDHVHLSGQRRVGLSNDGNAVATAALSIDTGGTAIVNTAAGGLIVLANASLRAAGEGAAMPRNQGAIVAYGVTLDGFAPPDNGPARLTGVWTGERWQRRDAREPVLEDSPRDANEPPETWANVLRYATTPDPDITEALRRAMASGAATVYLPFGAYTISDGIAIPPTLRRFVGMNASLTVRPERRPEFMRDTGMFRIAAAGPPLLIERLTFDMTDLGDQLAVQVAASRDVTLRDVVTAGASLLDREAGGGRVFIEDVCCGALKVSGAAPVYARQLNTEGGGTRIVNDGAPLTILGLKTEGDCTILDSRGGGRTVILGGLLYIVGDADPRLPAFIVRDATVHASFVEESFRSASRYAIYARDLQSHRDIRASEFPARGQGRIVPWLEVPSRRP
jgi:Pectate lyase superfamily protein